MKWISQGSCLEKGEMMMHLTLWEIDSRMKFQTKSGVWIGTVGAVPCGGPLLLSLREAVWHEGHTLQTREIER